MKALMSNIGGQLAYVPRSYLSRLKRWLSLLTLFLPISQRYYPYHPRRAYDWLAHFLLLTGDLMLVPDIYSLLTTLVKPNTRPVHAHEARAIRQVYGDLIDSRPLLIDDTARFVTRRQHIAYVAYNTINYWQRLDISVLVHEAMHILQYQRMGSIYIYEALKAQHSKAGYDYGGPNALYQSMMMGGRLLDYNFEQQAEIIEDGHRHLRLTGHVPIEYQYFMGQLGEI